MDTTITTKETQQKLPQLIKKSTTYKLIVPENVEQKIRYLIRKFPQTEWSGVLFYTHTGTFENNDLVITCQDIYPMDLGTAGWTEFHMSEDVAAYMAENIELFDYDMGLVHSHHTLGAFFSGQDVKMIQQEGNDTNCFVSLVVDTRGKYVAIVTRKVQSKSEVTVKRLGTSYEFFGEGSKDVTKDESVTTKVVDNEVIEYFDLEVERHEVPNPLDYLDTRFEEISRKKKSITPPQFMANWGSDFDKDKNIATSQYFSQFHNKKEPTLFDDATMKSLEKPVTKVVADPSDWTPDPKKVHAAVVKILTCSLILNPDKLDTKNWVAKHMENLYSKLFTDGTSFTEWADFIIQFVLDHFDLTDAPQELFDDGSVFNVIAQAIYDELFEYQNANEYTKDYCDALLLYI